MLSFRSDRSLFSRILIVLTIITTIFWLVSFVVARHFLKNIVWSEFAELTTRTISGIARQSVTDIKYADYFQAQRVLQGFYDKTYMNYIVIFTSNNQLFAMFPRQISGEDYMALEKNVMDNAVKSGVAIFDSTKAGQVFHFQQQITDENGSVLGYIAIGGTTKQLEKVLNTQTIFFTILGFLVLVIQITAIGYASRVLTRPLAELTLMLKKSEEIEPEKFLPTFMHQASPKGASSEVSLFYGVYQKLLQNIHAHLMHSQETAVQASIGKISSHVAHDLRTPISVLQGFVGCVKDDGRPSMREFKESALRSLQKMNQMADDLVDYSKAKQINPSPAALGKLLKDAVGEFAESTKAKGAVINVDCPDGLMAHIDGIKINRVLTNLIQNALHALLKHGGRIDVAARVTENGWLNISVADNGAGIDAKYLPRIFDSSFTLGKPSGTGLGLSYCRNVAEGHGGRISVESAVGKGSRFTIELPISARKLSDKQDDSSALLSERSSAPESARSILVVDDDPDMLVQWRQLLKEITGLNIVTASSPGEVLKINPDPKVFRAAICDYRYEGEDMTGIDLIEVLKERGIACRYLCTGFYYDPALREQAVAAGAHAIIPKPIPEGLVKQLLG